MKTLVGAGVGILIEARLKKVVPGRALKGRLTAKCQAELGKAWTPTYFMRTSYGYYKCFCKDPGHRCYVSVTVAA